MEFCTKNNISVTTRTTGFKHTRKVGFLTGVTLKIVSTTWYRDEIQKQLGILEGIIEIKKETIYQNNYKLVIYSVLSHAEDIDQQLMILKLWDGNHT